MAESSDLEAAEALAVVRCVECGRTLKGKTQAQAKAALRAGRCALGKLTRAYTARVKPGRVVAQSKRPRARLRQGAKIDLVLSRGRRR